MNKDVKMNKKCGLCDKEFCEITDSFKLNAVIHKHCYLLVCESHIQSLGDPKNVETKCPVCQKIFVKEDFVSIRKFVHSISFTCTICGQDQLLFDKLFSHCKEKHLNEAGSCPLCALQGTHRDSKHLYGHLMLRHREKNKDKKTIQQKGTD